MARRKGHFMPPELLKSQFATLEAPSPVEGALVVPIRLSPRKIAERILEAFDLEPARA